MRAKDFITEGKKPDFMKSGNMKPFKASGEEIPGAVVALEKSLLQAKKDGTKLNYNSIDKIMQKICHKHNLTGDELHNKFVDKHHAIPDNWIVKQLDEACWKGYHKEGMKTMFGKKYPNCVKNKSTNEEVELEENASGDSSLHDWFTKSKASDGTKGWVQIGGKYAGKPCAKQPGQTTKPKCGSSKMKRNLNAKEEEAAARRKRKEDPNPDRKGKAKNVATKSKRKTNEEAQQVDEKWSKKYKDSINCSNPKGFSQRAHCQGKKK